MYYYLITFACFAKAMKEGRELANNYVCQNLSVFSITTSSQRNRRPTLDCNSSPARYAQMLWPKLIFCYSDLRTLFNLCVTLMIVMVNFFISLSLFCPPLSVRHFWKWVLKLFPNRTRVTIMHSEMLYWDVLRVFSDISRCSQQCSRVFTDVL